MTDSPPVEKVDPETLILRAKPRRVIRIKRNLIIAGSAIGCIALVGLTWLGLSPSFIHPTLTVAHDKNPEKRAAGLPDHISALPKSYAYMPQLGEPLPGDLGRPILEHRRLHGTEFAGREAGDMPVPPRAAGNPQGASGLFFSWHQRPAYL